MLWSVSLLHPFLWLNDISFYEYSLISIGRTDAESETPAPILWPPDGKTDSLEKTLMLGKIEGRRRRE